MSNAPAVDLDQALANLAEQTARFIADEPATALVGIESGGVWIAEALSERLGLQQSPGVLNCGFYRDDFATSGLHPRIGPSHIDVDITDRPVVLIDDVFYTGRTARAGLNALFEYGRPARVRLAVLIDRGARELPLVPDAVGSCIDLAPERRIRLRGPTPLDLVIE